MLPTSDANELLRQLQDELENFEEIAKYLIPQQGELPRLSGIDVHGGTLALNGVVGGDHISSGSCRPSEGSTGTP